MEKACLSTSRHIGGAPLFAKLIYVLIYLGYKTNAPQMKMGVLILTRIRNSNELIPKIRPESLIENLKSKELQKI